MMTHSSGSWRAREDALTLVRKGGSNAVGRSPAGQVCARVWTIRRLLWIPPGPRRAAAGPGVHRRRPVRVRRGPMVRIRGGRPGAPDAPLRSTPATGQPALDFPGGPAAPPGGRHPGGPQRRGVRLRHGRGQSSTGTLAMRLSRWVLQAPASLKAAEHRGQALGRACRVALRHVWRQLPALRARHDPQARHADALSGKSTPRPRSARPLRPPPPPPVKIAEAAGPSVLLSLTASPDPVLSPLPLPLCTLEAPGRQGLEIDSGAHRGQEPGRLRRAEHSLHLPGRPHDALPRGHAAIHRSCPLRRKCSRAGLPPAAGESPQHSLEGLGGGGCCGDG